MKPAGVYPFTHGDFRCLALSDEGLVFFPATIYHDDVPERLVVETLHAHHASVDASPLQTSALYVETPDKEHRILFDAGVGYLPEGPDGRPFQGMVFANLQMVGVDPATIDTVIISHLHFDHIGVFDPEGGFLFPNARYLVASAEARFMEHPDLSGMREPLEFKQMIILSAQHFLQQTQGRVDLIEPGQELFPGIQALAAPGHTPGHLAFVLTSRGTPMYVISDALVHQVLSPRHPEWKCNLDADPEEAVRTRMALFSMAAAQRALVMASHAFWPSLGYVSEHEYASSRNSGPERSWVWHPVEFLWDEYR